MEAVLYTRAENAFKRRAVFETVVDSLRDAEPAPVFVF
jgi:hypothetical protein